MKPLSEVQAMFQNDRFATENGAVIEEVREGYARCSMLLTSRHRNAMGAVMGGATFTLADFAFAVASNCEEMNTVSVSSNIAFLGTAKGEKLIAEAKLIKDGRTTCYYQVSVTDDLGRLVAEVTAVGYHTK